MTRPTTIEQGIAEAARKARRGMDLDEQQRVAAMLARLPVNEVKARTGWSYTTLIKIAQVAL